MSRWFVYTLVVLLFSLGVHADELMDPNETLQLLTELTETPRRQWLDAGSIQARHLEYNHSEDKIKESIQTAYSDGSQMRLDIQLTSEDATSEHPEPHKQDFKLNRNRVFIRNGQQSIQYYKSAGYAVVTATDGTSDDFFCGPITAGIIPWGHGDFTFLVLKSQSPQAYKRTVDEGLQYVLKYVNTAIDPDVDVTFVLDPSKANAVLSYTIENDLALLQQTYRDYLKVEDQWIPTKVLIERFQKNDGAASLLSYEDWQIDAIDANTPESKDFTVEYENGTTVELHPGSNIETFMYDASNKVDVTSVLAEKIGLLSTDQSTVNCATAAIEHVAKRFSKEVSQEAMSGIVTADTRTTTLYDMKNIFEEAGLTCMAVTTDLNTLKNIENCAVILHLALTDHYVILDHVESKNAWIIDLTNRQFVTKRRINDLKEEWHNGTALLVSDQSITPPLDAALQYLDTAEMTAIQGGNLSTYSCTNLIQEEKEITCTQALGGFLCVGVYYKFSARYSCEEDPDGGTCTGKKLLSHSYTQCLNDPCAQGSCTITDDNWTSRYIRACK